MKTFDNRDSIYESKTLPTSGDSNSTSTKGGGRFRFPFRQKPLMMMSSSSAGSGSGGGGGGGREGGVGGGGGGGSSPYSLFNFRKLGNSKNTGGMTGVSAQPRKSVSFSGMDWKKKISADHTDVAYREAVSRLRSILSPRPHSLLDSSPLKGSLSDVSGVGLGKSFDLSSTSPPTSRRDRFNFRSIFSTKDAQSAQSPTHSMSKPLNNMSSIGGGLGGGGGGGLGGGYQSPNQLYSYLHRAVAANSNNCEDDLFEFINKQGEYIAQLEKETKYCRDDLTSMLDKVRDVITENEALHERQKRDLLNNMIDQLDEKTDGYESHGGGGGGGGGSRGSDKFGKNSTKSIMKSSSGKHSPGGGGGNVILESKIAEMDAQLSQAKRNLHLAQEEILELRKNRSQSVGLSSAMEQNIHNLIPANVNPYAHCDLHRAEIENLNREKQDLLETLSKFKLLMSELRDRESDAAKKVKNSLDIVETMQNEKTQSDLETRRLKDELERHQQRLRDFMTENSKKIQEEKLQIELKYRQEIDMLNSNINVEMDSLTRARVELERARRIEVELKRDIQVKSQTLEDLRQENLIRMGHMQSELSQALLMKSQAEQDLINSRLLIEKVERDGKQEAAKLQAEITGLRQRMEASDMDLINAQEIIVKLNENIGHLQRENSVLKGRDGGDESEMSKIIRSMEDKHSRDMTDLEQLIQAQNGLLDKLRGECKMLTDKLDDTSKQYRRERHLHEKEKERLLQASRVNLERKLDLEKRVHFYTGNNEEMTGRLRKMEEEDQIRSERDFMVELQSCVSTLRLDNEKIKENDPNHPPNGPAPEKVTALLKELEGVVSEMSKWLSTHSSAAADDDESEEEDDEEEESEEEDDDEEEAEAEELAETKEGEEEKKTKEGEAEKEGDAEEDADAATAKEEKEAPEPKSDPAEGGGGGEGEENEKEKSKEKEDEDEKEKGESEEGAESEAPPPTEGATGAAGGEEAGGKPEVPTASDDEAARDQTSKSPKEDADKKKEKDKKDHAESEADKKADKSKAHAPSKAKESAGAEAAAAAAAAAASTLSEMNERLEVWIQRIQSVIQRFSSYFPNKVGC